MKRILTHIFIINLCSLILVGCEDSIDNLNTSDTVSVETSKESNNIDKKVSAPIEITVQIETNLIRISWISVELATDYKVYIKSGDLDFESESTSENTHYSFATDAVESYQIRVTSISENGIESDFSSMVTVISKDQGTSLTCNECSP